MASQTVPSGRGSSRMGALHMDTAATVTAASAELYAGPVGAGASLVKAPGAQLRPLTLQEVEALVDDAARGTAGSPRRRIVKDADGRVALVAI